MGKFLQKFWPWSVIHVERVNIDNWTRTAIGHVGTIGVLEKELAEVRSDLVASKEDAVRALDYGTGVDRQLRRMVSENFAMNVKNTDLDEVNLRFAQSVVTLAEENETLKAKLTRKGIKHKNPRAKKILVSVYD